MPGHVLFSVNVACCRSDCVRPVNKCKSWELTPKLYFCMFIFLNRGQAFSKGFYEASWFLRRDRIYLMDVWFPVCVHVRISFGNSDTEAWTSCRLDKTDSSEVRRGILHYIHVQVQKNCGMMQVLEVREEHVLSLAAESTCPALRVPVCNQSGSRMLSAAQLHSQVG